MKAYKYIQWFPSFLMIIGVGLWVNSLFFSPITNRYEHKLKDYWETNFERSNPLLDSINQDIILGMETTTVDRPDDQPMFHFANQIVNAQQIATQALTENLENSDSNTFQIIQAFKNQTASILWKSEEIHPLVVEEEIKYLMARNSFVYSTPFNDIAYKIAFEKNQIRSKSSAYINYLSSKIGSTVLCCLNYPKPRLKFNQTLKKGKTQKGYIFLHYPPCGYNPEYNVRVNGHPLILKNGISSLTTTFKNASPQVFDVEFESYETFYRKKKFVSDTIITKEQFIIYPIQK